MSAEDAMMPPDRWLPDHLASPPLSPELRPEFWDDAESNQRNLEIIGWWLSLTQDAEREGTY